MTKINRIIETIIVPAMEQLVQGVIVMNGIVAEEMRIVGTLFEIVGDMELRQQLLSLRNYVAPSLPPTIAPLNAESLFAIEQPRSIDAHVELLRWAQMKMSGRGEIGVARTALKAAGCIYDDAVVLPALALPAFAFWRTVGSYQMAAE